MCVIMGVGNICVLLSCVMYVVVIVCCCVVVGKIVDWYCEFLLGFCWFSWVGLCVIEKNICSSWLYVICVGL